MRDWLKKNPPSKSQMKPGDPSRLPVIIPVVLYTGASGFPHSMDFFDLFGSQRELAKELWQKPCTLVDLSQMSEAELGKYTYFKAAALAAKYVHQLGRKDFVKTLSLILDELRILDALGEEEYIKITIQYLAAAGKIPDKEVFVKSIQEKLSEETAMNLLQEFEKDGFQKGIQQGLEKGKLEGKIEGKLEGKMEGKLETLHQMACKLLEKGYSLQEVADLTEFSLKELRELQKKHSH